ncbi:MAG TPA: flagellar motor protein MotA [Gammaproteobacteria bacterium]|nr:flagellar motor protein MotA [Gammaproteobacteria bacterium]
MTRPTHVYVWMIPFLALVGLAAGLLYVPLAEAFMSNAVLNGIILGVFLIGIIINFRQVGMLSSEVAWINHFRGKPKHFWQSIPDEPRLLAPLAKMLRQHDREFLSLSPLSLRSLLDSVRMRLDEERDVSRYMIGLLIFLGLLGTFWGLLVTVSAVGDIIGDLAGGSGSDTLMFGTLLEGLKQPLSGMGTAFSSSLFGLAGSLVLGFLDLQSGHAQNRFFNELEDWLSGVTRLSSQLIGDREPSEPAYIHAMLEQTAETLDRLQRSVAREETQRQALTDQIQGLGKELAVLADLAREEKHLLASLARGQNELAPAVARLADTRADSDEAINEHIRNLDINIGRLADELAAGREHLSQEIRDELRLIGRALTAETRSQARQRKQIKAH